MLTKDQYAAIQSAKEAALSILIRNSDGPYDHLPRTAGWGYPEPYTRDLLVASLGIAVSDNKQLHDTIKRVLENLAANQTRHGHIPSIVNDPKNRGASDTTPLFLIAVGIYRKLTKQGHFLSEAVDKALNWMAHQSPTDQVLVAQQPTTDWRDEQWVLGYGLYVNVLYCCGLQLLDQRQRKSWLAQAVNTFFIEPDQPYYSFWVFKLYRGDGFDLLGNSLAIVTGIASLPRARAIIDWVEHRCREMRSNGQLASDLPPNFFPYTYPGDRDWHPRYRLHNLPGNYHNGGIWPFICGFYIAALVTAGELELAEKKLLSLTALVEKAIDPKLGYGFNEWANSQTGTPKGADWQTWSASLYLYAVECVTKNTTPFLTGIA